MTDLVENIKTELQNKINYCLFSLGEVTNEIIESAVTKFKETDFHQHMNLFENQKTQNLAHPCDWNPFYLSYPLVKRQKLLNNILRMHNDSNKLIDDMHSKLSSPEDCEKMLKKWDLLLHVNLLINFLNLSLVK